MSFKQALLQNTSWKIAGLVFIFINTIIIARLLGVEQNGLFFYAVTFLTLFITCLRLGIENGIVYLSSKNPDSTATLFFLLFPLILLQTVIVFLIINNIHFEQQIFGVFWATGFISANIFIYYITAFFHARKDFSTSNIVNTIAGLLQTVALSLVLFVQHGDVINARSYVFMVLSFITVLQAFLLSFLFYRKYRLFFTGIHFNESLIKGLFSYAGISFLCSIILFLTGRIDFYFIEKYCDPYILGNYIQASKIGQMTLIIPGLIGGVVFPFSINAEDSFKDKIALLCRLLSLCFLLLFAGLLIFGYSIFPWLLGSRFDLVYPIILISISGFFFNALSVILISYFEGANRQYIILGACFTSFCFIVAGDFYFVPRYGYLAAAVIFSLASAVGMLILLYYFTRSTHLSAGSLFRFSIKDIRAVKMLRTAEK